MINGSLTVDQALRLAHALEQSNIDEKEVSSIIGKESFWNRAKAKISGTAELNTIQKVAQLANKTFECLEQKSVKLFVDLNNDAVKQKAEAYRNRFTVYLKLAAQIQKRAENLKKSSPEALKAFHELECNLIGLKYSLGGVNGGINKLNQPDPVTFNQLKTMALKWKLKQPLALEKELNELEIKQLEEAAKYPEWFPVLVKNPAYQMEFFNWTIRDYCPVDVFIECRHTQQTLKYALLPGIIGRIRKPNEEGILHFKKVNTKIAGIQKRILVMPFYHGSYKEFEPAKQEYLNILNPNKKVTFQRGQFTMTLKEMWDEQASKNARESKINLGHDGFVNFEPMEGEWNAQQKKYTWPNPTAENWVDHIPAADVISHAQLLERHRAEFRDKIDNKKMFFKVMSTRQSLDLQVTRAHGFWQFYIYMGNDKWKVLDLGFYANEFPVGAWNNLKFFCHTVPRVLAMMDQNGSYSQRQSASMTYFPSEEESRALLSRVHQIMHESHVFQFGGRNCSYPIQMETQQVMRDIPNFFQMPLTRAKTGFPPLDKLLAFFDKCPAVIRNIGLKIIHFIFGSFRGITINRNGKNEWISLNEFRAKHPNMVMFHPAYLHRQIEEGRKTKKGPFVTGNITWGNTSLKLPFRAD